MAFSVSLCHPRRCESEDKQEKFLVLFLFSGDFSDVSCRSSYRILARMGEEIEWVPLPIIDGGGIGQSFFGRYGEPRSLGLVPIDDPC